MASIYKNLIANYIGRGWTSLISILFTPLYLKFVGIEAYGLVGVYTALTVILGVFDLGIGSTMNRELARLSAIDESERAQRDLVRTMEILYWAIAISLGVVVLCLAPYISSSWVKAQSLNSRSILTSVELMGICVAFQFPMSLYQGGLMGLQRQVLANGILAALATLRGVGIVLVLWLWSPTIESFFKCQVFYTAIGTGIFLLTIWRCLPKHHVPAHFSAQIIRDVRKYAVAVSVNSVIGLAVSQLDKVVLSKMLTLKMFGYYTLATTAASAIWLVIIPFNTATFPRFVQLNESRNTAGLCTFFHGSSQALSIVLLPISAVLIIFSRPILHVWLNDDVAVKNCSLVLSFLALGIMLNGIASIPGYSASAFGWPELVTYTNAAQAVVVIPLTVVLVYRFQALGAAITSVILNSTYVVFMVPAYFSRYLSRERPAWYFHDIGLPAAAAFLTCICSFLIAPSLNSRSGATAWLILTWGTAVVVTGLTQPQIRTLCARNRIAYRVLAPFNTMNRL